MKQSLNALWMITLACCLKPWAADAQTIYPGSSLTTSNPTFGHELIHPSQSPELVSGMVRAGEDAEYVYYRNQSALFRYFKKPKPIMSYIDPRPIPQAPSLFWPGVLEFVKDDSGPAKPNCSERSFKFSDYLNLVKNPSIRTKSDFLRSLPKDALQKFTFIFESHSLQRYGVSKSTPRVMRFSTDGKMILTYTTNKDTAGIDGIEVMYFDDQTRRYGFAHTDFVSESEITKKESSPKTVLNPKACFACHGGLDPRPNWNQYASWPGVYGDRDDLIMSGYSGSNFAAYQSMRKELEGTAEIETLPWPAKSSSLFQTFPYATIEKEMNYNLRPNAHLTIVSSRLNAVRLARKIEESPVYSKVKWSLMSAALKCGSDPVENPVLKKALALQNYKERPFQHNPSSIDGLEVLYRFGESLQFKNTDWSLRFNERPSLQYEHYHTAQWEMADYILSVLFRDLAKVDPKLAPYDLRINRMSILFGKDFTCVDDIADRMWMTDATQALACQVIAENKKIEVASLQTNDLGLVDQISNPTWDPSIKREDSFFSSIETGKKIVTGLCSQCHDGTVLPFHFKDPGYFHRPDVAPAKAGLLKTIEAALGSPESCRMPKPIAGKCLSDSERKSVLKYIESQ